jgi:simple sugar transport system permease protein
MVLGYLVYGPWKDPSGYNFPQTKSFEAVTQIPRLMSGSRVSVGLILALVGVAAVWIFLFRTRSGFAQQVGGLAPSAARYAGFSSRKALWLALLTSGGAAGLAGMFYIGGELAQSRMGLPKSITGVFQGLLLFSLLACDTLVAYRLRWQSGRA